MESNVVTVCVLNCKQKKGKCNHQIHEFTFTRIESESDIFRQRISLRPVFPPFPSLHPGLPTYLGCLLRLHMSSIVIQPEFEFIFPPGEPEHRQPVQPAEQPRPSPHQPHHPSAGRPVQPPRGRDDGGGTVPHGGVQHPRPPSRPGPTSLPRACLSHQLAKPPARFFQHCRPSPPPKEI